MNILDYLATEFATFDEKPLNAVDAAILSQICMIRCEGIVPELNLPPSDGKAAVSDAVRGGEEANGAPVAGAEGARPDASDAEAGEESSQARAGDGPEHEEPAPSRLGRLKETLLRLAARRPGKPSPGADVPAASDGSGPVPAPKIAPLPGIPFTDLLRAERYETMFSGLDPDNILACLPAVAASPRFRGLRICAYTSTFDPGRHTQFAAMTFVYRDEFAFVGFRGTDTSFTGWRENFNMACSETVPAQGLALRYLRAVAARVPARIVVGGHSKGGNLALYAALRAPADVQRRIERVYSLDGPGFKAGSFAAADWQRLEGRIERIVPQESVVGMLMESHVPPRVVRSTEHGLLQHSVFSWEVDGSGFAWAPGLADSARLTGAVMGEWLARYTDDEAAEIVEALFQAIELSGARDAYEVFFGGSKTIGLVTEAAKRLDGPARDTLLGALGALAEITARATAQGIVQRIAPKPKG